MTQSGSHPTRLHCTETPLGIGTSAAMVNPLIKGTTPKHNVN
jgi:hypothetical protein